MNEIQEMDRLFDRLFPIMHSITGQGVRETIQILEEYIPLKLEGVPSGTQLFDWEIPKEWVIRGKLWVTTDWLPQHLGFVYNQYNNDSVDQFLDGKLPKINPPIISALEKRSRYEKIN
ncbi:DUF4910 domain-containing protein [Lysinibacillus sp. NPDC047702]|uniref:DUF4910 domain-containing protein n=1 Tax=unclassified Lysinibacillus TaxID=2636778 RepID=UPI003D08829F